VAVAGILELTAALALSTQAVLATSIPHAPPARSGRLGAPAHATLGAHPETSPRASLPRPPEPLPPDQRAYAAQKQLANEGKIGRGSGVVTLSSTPAAVPATGSTATRPGTPLE